MNPKTCIICGCQLDGRQRFYCTFCSGNIVDAKHKKFTIEKQHEYAREQALRRKNIEREKNNNLSKAMAELEKFNNERRKKGLETLTYGKWVEYIETSKKSN